MDQRPRPGGFNRCNQPVALLCVIITNEIRINRHLYPSQRHYLQMF
ncbi:Uncharacterised protein [Shigella sonnei]|nr:Uncharacterised protein [Shigella sonnei]